MREQRLRTYTDLFRALGRVQLLDAARNAYATDPTIERDLADARAAVSLVGPPRFADEIADFVIEYIQGISAREEYMEKHLGDEEHFNNVIAGTTDSPSTDGGCSSRLANCSEP